MADTKAARFHYQLQKMGRALSLLHSKYVYSHRTTARTQAQYTKLQSTLKTTKDNYETMIHDLTERLCQLTEQIARQDARNMQEQG